MPALPDAVWPFKPFEQPLNIPAGLPTDGDTFCIKINATWLPYVMGCCLALMADSTWNSDDPTVVLDVERRAWTLLSQMIAPEACPLPVQFRNNPSAPIFWQFSNDGGVTWDDQPNCVQFFTPVFVIDGTAPGGYRLTVNTGISDGAVPLLTATDPNAVVTDPTSLLRNEITAGAGVDGIVIQALAQIGVKLQSNGVAAAFQKIPGLGLAADAVEAIAVGSDYTFPLLAIVDAI